MILNLVFFFFTAPVLTASQSTTASRNPLQTGKTINAALTPASKHFTGIM
jgi:hypothetical protein